MSGRKSRQKRVRSRERARVTKKQKKETNYFVLEPKGWPKTPTNLEHRTHV
jgi:hypothetical protein